MTERNDAIPPVNVEIVFVGLCSFLNTEDKNDTMPEPSVILVRTPEDKAHLHSACCAGSDAESVEHTAFIAYNSNEAWVSDPSGFYQVDPQRPFFYYALDGVEVRIKDNPIETPDDKPSVDESYHFVAKKDDYWPEVKNQWDRLYVPERGDYPDSGKVAAFMKFGKGRVYAQNRTRHRWAFRDVYGTLRLIGHFLREVVYTDFPHTEEKLAIALYSLDDQNLVHEFYFKALDDRPTIRLWIGNLMKSDLLGGLTGAREKANANAGAHFAFLNAVAGYGLEQGPIPIPIEEKDDDENANDGGAGETGYCGPGSANH